MTTDNAIAGTISSSLYLTLPPANLAVDDITHAHHGGHRSDTTGGTFYVSPCGLRGRSMKRGSVPLWRACLAPLLGRGVAPPPPPLRTAREQFCIFSCTLCRRSSVYYGF